MNQINNKTMRVINVIEHNADGIVSIDTFGIADEQLADDIVEQAEELFIEKVIKLEEDNNGNLTKTNKDNIRDEATTALDDGYWENKDWFISLVWSDINNVQL